MKVGIHANMCDLETERISQALSAPLDAIGKELSQDYGGAMEHLWIDFELVQEPLGRERPWAFRFQKKVGGSTPDRITGLPRSTYFNVGHYSVRPNFQELANVPEDCVVTYVLGVIYASTSVLLEKQKRLGGFDAPKFRAEFLAACKKHGYELSVGDGAR